MALKRRFSLVRRRTGTGTCTNHARLEIHEISHKTLSTSPAKFFLPHPLQKETIFHFHFESHRTLLCSIARPHHLERWKSQGGVPITAPYFASPIA
jgi:hypothetical protein